MDPRIEILQEVLEFVKQKAKAELSWPHSENISKEQAKINKRKFVFAIGIIKFVNDRIKQIKLENSNG